MNSSIDDFECVDDLSEAVGPILQEVLPENEGSDDMDVICSELFSLLKRLVTTLLVSGCSSI